MKCGRRCLFLGTFVAMAGMGIGPGMANAAESSFLGTVEFGSADLGALEQWQDVLARIALERKVYEKCEASFAACSPPALLAWRAMIERLKGKPLLQQIEAVNQFVNSRPERADRDAFGKEDYWASPLEFLEHSGDGEDFAIMKFISLRELGVSNQQLRLLVADDTLVNRREVIVVVYDHGRPLFLGSEWGFVAEEKHLPYHIPYYSMNEERRWTHHRVLEAAEKE